MKSNKTIGILLVVLAVLLGVWLLRMYLPNDNPDKETYAEWWDEMKAENVMALVVEQDDQRLEMSKEGTQWLTNGVKVDTDTIDELLTNLLTPTEVTVVAVTPAQHEALGVASGSAILTLKTETTEKAVRLGNSTTSGRYVRLGDGETVYLVAKLPVGIDSTMVNDWVDKTLVSIPEDSITRLTIDDNSEELTLVKREGEWYQPDSDVALDMSPLAAALSTLSSLMTQGLVEPDTEEVFASEATLRVTVERNDGEPVTLSFFEGEAEAKVTSSERAGSFRLSSSVVDNFRIEAALKPKPTSTPASEASE